MRKRTCVSTAGGYTRVCPPFRGRRRHPLPPRRNGREGVGRLAPDDDSNGLARHSEAAQEAHEPCRFHRFAKVEAAAGLGIYSSGAPKAEIVLNPEDLRGQARLLGEWPDREIVHSAPQVSRCREQ